MKGNIESRGEAFDRYVRHIVAHDRRVGNDILLFDDYAFTSLILRPLRTRYTVAVNILEGKGHALVNSVIYGFEAPCLVVFVPGQIFQLVDRTETPVRSRAMLLSESFMNEFYGESFRMNEIFAPLLVNPVIALDDNSSIYLETYVKSCILGISNVSNTRRYDVIRHLTIALFYGALIGICSKNKSSGNRSSEICSEFMALLKIHFSEEHKLEFYASQLCITPRYLSICVKAVTGNTPGYWIDFYVLSESKRLLRVTDHTIDRISENLGFVSQSVFGKFFKRLVGVSPTEYRNANPSNPGII